MRLGNVNEAGRSLAFRIGTGVIAMLVAASGAGVAVSTIVGPQPAQQPEPSPPVASDPGAPSWNLPLVGGVLRATEGGGSPVSLGAPERFFSFIFGNVTNTPSTDCTNGSTFYGYDTQYGYEYSCNPATASATATTAPS